MNILPLGWYDVLVDMDFLEKHGSVTNDLENFVTCTNYEGVVKSLKENLDHSQ